LTASATTIFGVVINRWITTPQALQFGKFVMQQLRLFGLALFITAIFIAMAAAITKTTHIHFQTQGNAGEQQPNVQQPNVQQPGVQQPSVVGDSFVLPPLNEPGFSANEPQSDLNGVRFTSVPIVWPLIIAAGVGLSMWFMGSRREA
jgi:hypothetical protein